MTLRVSILPLATLCIIALTVSGCSSMRGNQRVSTAPEQLNPIQSSNVASSALPPIGQDGNVQFGQSANPGPLVPEPSLTGQPGAVQTFGSPTQTANGGSFVTLDAVGAVPNTPGRDLSGGLTVPKLLGGWTVISGATQCRLNLTQTAKSGTQRYRASTPGCALAALGAVSSWQLAGSQVQLFDESNTMVAALILSGNRFIGTLSGGQGISMVG